jgi:hypothetical protein
MDSTRNNIDFEANVDDMLQEDQHKFNNNLEKHLYLSLVKSLGLVLTDRKKFEM